MKIALYIEDGLEQIVLTPESDTERGIIGKLHDGSRDLSIKRGSFYQCRGGWSRQSENDDSTMIVLRAKEEAAAAGERRMINGAPHVARPFAYCCAEGGGRVEGCSCVKQDHGVAWYPEAAPE